MLFEQTNKSNAYNEKKLIQLHKYLKNNEVNPGLK